MSFVEKFQNLPVAAYLEASHRTTAEEVHQSLRKPRLQFVDFLRLISPAARNELEWMGQRSHQLTQKRFGKTIRLFAPLYLSNECINNCQYCGFSRDNPILRTTLTPEEVSREAMALRTQGFRNILLVSGEHPKFVASNYLVECIRWTHQFAPSVSLEIGPCETKDYIPLVTAGADGLVVYQETYNREVYREMHTSGPKKDFDWRLETPERAYHAGFRRIGIGALFGLSDWRCEAIALAAHAEYLQRRCWKSNLTISFPRLRPCAGEFHPPHPMPDRDLVQALCAFRLFLPDAGIVLSTREPATLRNGLIPLGVTLLSAGSHTEPGGYTGAGSNHLHQTRRGRPVPAAPTQTAHLTKATGQFDIADTRSPDSVAQFLNSVGYEPVWKDWDTALTP